MKLKKTTFYFFALCLTFLLVPSVYSAVLVKKNRWSPGTVLNVVFLDGSIKLHQQVKKIAAEWLQDSSLSFRFFSHWSSLPKQTHIRVSFVQSTGSRLGDHGDYLSKQATMNLAGINTAQISENSVRRIILHEFGHALGFEHEYRSAYWPYGEVSIQSIITNCYPKMKQIGYTQQSAETHCTAVNAPLDIKLTEQTAYDEASIMNYPLSFNLDDSKIEIKPSFNLSLLDRYAIQHWYGQ